MITATKLTDDSIFLVWKNVPQGTEYVLIRLDDFPLGYAPFANGEITITDVEGDTVKVSVDYFDINGDMIEYAGEATYVDMTTQSQSSSSQQTQPNPDQSTANTDSSALAPDTPTQSDGNSSSPSTGSTSSGDSSADISSSSNPPQTDMTNQPQSNLIDSATVTAQTESARATSGPIPAFVPWLAGIGGAVVVILVSVAIVTKKLSAKALAQREDPRGDLERLFPEPLADPAQKSQPPTTPEPTPPVATPPAPPVSPADNSLDQQT